MKYTGVNGVYIRDMAIIRRCRSGWPPVINVGDFSHHWVQPTLTEIQAVDDQWPLRLCRHRRRDRYRWAILLAECTRSQTPPWRRVHTQ